MARPARPIVPFVVFLTAIAIMAGVYWDAYALSKTQHKQQKLQALSRTFAVRLEAKRPQLDYDLLKSENPAQKNLNENPNFQLMYIESTGELRFYKINNIDAARTISTDDVWPGGSGGFNLSGAGTVRGELGIWDAGDVRITHQEYAGRVFQEDALVGTHFHATHVAGTMVATGVKPNAQGMSYQAILSAYDWNTDNAEMAAAAAAGMTVSNHSYGYGAGWEYSGGDWYWLGWTAISTVEDYGFGFYDQSAADWDQIAYDAENYTIVNSVGNDRNDFGPTPGDSHYVWNGSDWVWSTAVRDPDGGADGYDCIPWTANAKNTLVIAAVEDIPGGWTAPGDVVITTFSSWGPTDDGRIKPDLSTNGYQLYSTLNTTDTAYATFSGTSMAAPNCSGSLNLLVRHYETTHGGTTPRSATMKAVLVKTADAAGSADGPDYEHGWGLMNTLTAAQLIQADVTDGPRIVEATLDQGETHRYFIYNASEETPIKMTMAWTDPPGTPLPPSLNPTTIMLVNDLDMRMRHLPTGTIYYPWILDPANPANAATTGDNYRDNVEQVYIENPAEGWYEVTVRHKGTLEDNLQKYSIVDSRKFKTCFTAVELSTFAALSGQGCIELDWITGTEIENAGFNLFRAMSEEGEQTKLNEGLIPSKVEIEGATYSFKDNDVTAGETYYYWLESVDLGGGTTRHPPVVVTKEDDDASVPAVFALGQNYPNPFNPTTEIRYDLPSGSRVKLEIYNVLGARVATLVDEHQKAGSKIASWDGRDVNGAPVSSGVYFYKLQAGSYTEIRKMILLR